MVSARITQSVARGDGSSYAVGDEVTGEVAQDAISGGWGEPVRQQVPETPEATQTRVQGRPERRRR